MISAEILKTVRPENVKSLWPGIVDIDEAQAGGCPGFWNKYFPKADPLAIICYCRCLHDWARFWEEACPAGQLRFVVTDVWKSERKESDLEGGREYGSGEEDDFVVRALEEVVKGRLTSDDPSFFLRDGPDLVLVWPFSAP